MPRLSVSMMAMFASGNAAALWRFESCGAWPSTQLLPPKLPGTLVLTSGPCLHHLNASSGEEIWRHHSDALRSSTPVLDEQTDVVFYGRQGGVAEGAYVIEAVSLRERRKVWTSQTVGMPTQPVLSDDGRFVMFGESTDEQLGVVRCLSSVNGSELWSRATHSAVHKAPTLSRCGQRIYVSDQTTLSAIGAADGREHWSLAVPGAVDSSPVEHADGSLVYVGARQFHMHALNASNGEVVWSFRTKGFIVSSPVLSPDASKLYFVANDGYVYALRAYSGEFLWSRDVCVGCELLPQSVPVLSSDGLHLFLGSGEKQFVSLNALTGVLEWNVKMPGMVYAKPVLSAESDVVFVSSGGQRRGQVLALPTSGSGLDSDTCPTTSTWPPSQMDDSSHCDVLGLTDLASYRFGLPLPEPEGLRAKSSKSDPSGFLPYFGTEPLDGATNSKITNAVIWIHGLGGDANKFFCDGIAAALAAGVREETLVLTPWFGNEKMTNDVWPPTGDTPYGDVSTCWKTSSWLKGGNSYPSASGGRSTFALLDALIKAVLNSSRFPNLAQITVAGFSAGCQLTTRWVVFSETAKQVTLIAGDCGTYFFLDNKRPADSCNSPENTGVDHSCASFSTPSNGSECSMYNDYKYGADLSVVQSNNYVEAFADDASKFEQAITEFPQKKVHFLLGDLDVCACNVPSMKNQASCFPKDATCSPTEFGGCCDTYPDSTTHNACSHTCEALTGGTNRLQRGLNYVAYLSDFYAKRGVTYTPSVGIFHGAHNNTAWGLSPYFSQWAGWSTAPNTVFL